jgi:hypothetical protein
MPTPLAHVQRPLSQERTITPEELATPIFNEKLYSLDHPAIEPDEINALLEIIKQSYLSGITKEGWYASMDPYQKDQVWVYIDNPETKSIKEMFLTISVLDYSNPLGDVIVEQILLPDGKNGFFGLNEARSDTVITILNEYAVNMTYSMGGGFPPYFFLLENHFVNAMIDLSLIQGKPEEQSPFQIETTTKAWMSGEWDNRLLQIEIRSVGLAGRKSLESDARQTKATATYRFDWSSGNWVSFDMKQLYNDGTVLETILDEERLSKYKYQYYESLPAKVQQLYDDAARKVREAYAAQGIN